MSVVNITFIGGEECGDVGSTTLGMPPNDIVFPLNKSVSVDATLHEHLIANARNSPHFKVEETKESKDRKGQPAEDDYPEEPPAKPAAKPASTPAKKKG